MTENLLQNGGFESDWSEQASHTCLVLPSNDDAYTKDIENINTPPHWVTWFVHHPGEYDQPEVRDAWGGGVPDRAHSGAKGILLFTFNRRHDGGFFQCIEIEPGRWVTVFLRSRTLWAFRNNDAYWDDITLTRSGSWFTLSAFAHAWSNHNVLGYEHYGDARCSVGVGCGPVCIPEGEAPLLNGDPLSDAIGNFTFWVGIDPTGEVDPFASSVVWSAGQHAYNGYPDEPLSVTVRASGLIGGPREQYERTYVLLPPGAGKAWANAVVEARWDSDRWTIGGSADDAGIGDLDVRRVIAVNPLEWGDELSAWVAEHYPGAEYMPIEAKTPDELYYTLRAQEF